MNQLTREEAIAFHDEKRWEGMSHLDRALFQMEQEKLCMPFSVFHESTEKALGYSVFTHQFATCHEQLLVELRRLKAQQETPS